MADGATTRRGGSRPGPGRRKPATEPITSPDPIEIAMEAEAHGRAPDATARRLLEKQALLTDADLKHRRWQIANERAGFLLKLLLGAAGVVAAVALVLMAWEASRDRSLIIDPVGVTEAMAKEGAGGEALAHALQDKLIQLQDDTGSMFAAAEVRGRPADDVKVVIPTTGVSIGELNRALREWLGHQTHVTAEVSRATSGPEAGALVFAGRVGAQPGVRLVQKDGDLDALLSAGAERLYAQLDPLQHGWWMATHGRQEEAIAVFRTLSTTGPDSQRSVALYQLAGLLHLRDPPGAYRDRLAEAVRLAPTAYGFGQLGIAEFLLGHMEAMHHDDLEAARLQRADRGLTREVRDEVAVRSSARAALALGDINQAEACRFLDLSPCNGPAVARRFASQPDLALTTSDWLITSSLLMVGAHEPSGAEILVRAPRPKQPEADQQALMDSLWLLAQLSIDREREDWPSVIRDTDAFDAVTAPYPGFHVPVGDQFRPVALAGLGDMAAAERAAAAQPPDCYYCLLLHAQIAALRQDWQTGERLCAEALRQGPSLPQAETEWARELLLQGRPDEAIAKLSKAQAKAPRSADPREYWGEALIAKGDFAGATAKFQQANALAPNWGRLHLKWGEALSRAGKGEAAQAQYRLAASLDLTPTERAEFAKVSR